MPVTEQAIGVLLGTGALLGNAQSETYALLSRAALRKLNAESRVLAEGAAAGAVAGFDSIRQPVERLSKVMGAANSPSALVRWLTTPDALSLGLDALAREDLRAGQLVLTETGVSELVVRDARGLAQQTMAMLGTALQSNEEQASMLLQSVWGAAALREAAQAVVQAEPSMKGLPNGANADLKGLVENWLVPKAREHLENIVKSAMGVVPGSGDLAGKAAAWRGEAAKLNAMGNAAAGMLTLLGRNELALELQRGLSYANAAVQVGTNCVALFATGASGFGMALAAAGMLQGLGGLGAFGGPAADPGYAPVLKAIQELARHLDAQFRKVNEKLDAIFQTLGDVARQLTEVGRDVHKVLASLDRVHHRLTQILNNQEHSAYQLQYNDFKRESARHHRWTGRNTARPTSAEIYEGLHLHATWAMEVAASGPMLLLRPDPERVFDSLEGATGPRADPDYVWSAPYVLQAALEHYEIPAPSGRLIFWPILATSVDLALSLSEQPAFNELSPQEQLQTLKPLYLAMDVHEQQVRRWRCGTDDGRFPQTWEGHAMLSGLVSHYESCVKGLQAHYDEMRHEAVQEILAAVKQGATGVLRAARAKGAASAKFSEYAFRHVTVPPPLRNVDARYGTEWKGLFTSHAAATAWSGASKYWKTYVPDEQGSDAGPGSFNSFPAFELVSAHRPRPRVPQAQVNTAEPVNLTYRLSVYGRVMEEATFEQELQFKWPNPTDHTVTPTDPVEFLSQADGWKDGGAGSEALGVRFGQEMSNREPEVETRQRWRIESNEGLLMGYVAYKLMVDPNWQAAQALRAAFEELRLLRTTLRALCKLAYSDIYAANISLSAMFDGGLESRLADESFLPACAEAVADVYVSRSWPGADDDAGAPLKWAARHYMAFAAPDSSDGGVPDPRHNLIKPHEVARLRLDKLKRELNQMLQAVATWGDHAEHALLQAGLARLAVRVSSRI